MTTQTLGLWDPNLGADSALWFRGPNDLRQWVQQHRDALLAPGRTQVIDADGNPLSDDPLAYVEQL